MTPNPQRHSAILHNHPHSDSELLFAAVASPQETLVPRTVLALHLHDLSASTVRAGGLVAPSLLLQELHRSRFVKASLWDCPEHFGLTFTSMTYLLFHTIIVLDAQCVSTRNPEKIVHFSR